MGRRMMIMEVDGMRGRERPKRRWMDSMRDDLSEKGLTGNEVGDRRARRQLIKNVDPVKRR